MIQRVSALCFCICLCTAGPAARADTGWSANLNLVSDYRFRGIDQTWGRPALQGASIGPAQAAGTSAPGRAT